MSACVVCVSLCPSVPDFVKELVKVRKHQPSSLYIWASWVNLMMSCQMDRNALAVTHCRTVYNKWSLLVSIPNHLLLESPMEARHKKMNVFMPLGGILFLCTFRLLACQVGVTAGNSGLYCCVCVQELINRFLCLFILRMYLWWSLCMLHLLTWSLKRLSSFNYPNILKAIISFTSSSLPIT